MAPIDGQVAGFDPRRLPDDPGQGREFEGRFFELSLDLLCVLDFSGFFRQLNPAWEQVLGYARSEMLARPFIEFVHPDDRERTLSQNRDVRGGSKAWHFENRYVCKDGSFRWLLWNSTRDPERQVIYGVARDITRRKAIEQERDRLLAELQAARAEVDALQDFLPICAYCKNVRDDENYWQSVEAYLARRTNTRLSHGICPSCFDKVKVE